MNKIATTPRGFPFDELTLQELQDISVPVLNAIGRILPTNSIVYGCGFTESLQRASGFISWNNEWLPFVGGANSINFSIVEEILERPFNVGTDIDPQMEDHPAYYKRYAKIGIVEGAESTHAFSALKPAPKLLTYLKKAVVYIGNVVPTIFSLINESESNTIITITFPSVGLSNYLILMNFHRSNEAAQGDFDYDIFAKTATSFKIRIKNVTATINNVSVSYLLIPNDIQIAQNP